MGGMLEFEKITGRKLLQGFKLEDMSVEDISALLWACLIHEDKELTFETFLPTIEDSNPMLVIEAITNCMRQSIPSPKTDTGESPLAEMPPSG